MAMPTDMKPAVTKLSCQASPLYPARLIGDSAAVPNTAATFVLHSLRHTMLTRLGESGVDAFTIMRIAGHSSIVLSQRYVHPTPEAMDRAL
jgi:integrase